MLAALAFQAPAPRTWSGKWVASSSGRQLGGTWTAVDYGDELESGGRWEVLDQNGRPVLSGTWNARKREAGWDGSWVARGLKGGRWEGLWAARLRISPKLPLVEMFKQARKAPVTGTWTDSAGRRGAWTVWAD